MQQGKNEMQHDGKSGARRAAEEYFAALRRRDAAIDRRRRTLEDERAALYRIGGAPAGDRVQQSPRPDAPYARTLQKIADTEGELDAELLELVAEKDAAARLIYALGDTREADALYMRQMRREGFAEIGRQLGCSQKTARSVFDGAMEHFGAMLMDGAR